MDYNFWVFHYFKMLMESSPKSISVVFITDKVLQISSLSNERFNMLEVEVRMNVQIQ